MRFLASLGMTGASLGMTGSFGRNGKRTSLGAHLRVYFGSCGVTRLSAGMVHFTVLMVDAIGWVSSVILLATIGKQIYKQWHDRTSRGVSLWLFIGQLAASVGFTIYSLLLRNWVFAVTNGLMVLNGLVGYAITLRQKTAPATAETDAGAR